MPIKNVFACLVHEKPDVIWDMVCNLRYLDPASCVLLYNNSGSAALLDDCRFRSDPHVLIYPETKRHPYPWSHGSMLNCMRWACRDRDLDTITNVDSDQLLLRPGYTERLTQVFAQFPNFGMLQSSPVTLGWPADSATALIPLGFVGGLSGPAVINYPQFTALNELQSWGPFLGKFDRGSGYRYSGLNHFPKWSFWPAVAFSRQAAQATLTLYDSDLYLRALLGRTQIFAAEEVIFPTLLSLLGFDLVRTPFDEKYVRFQTIYSVDTLEESLQLPDCFWMHPVPRDMNDPVRMRLRQHYSNYQQD